MPELYDFQKADLEKVFPLGLGANGGEMGTGKTPWAIKLMEAWWDDLVAPKKKTCAGDLIIAPLNTFDGWRKRYAEWAPNTDLFVMPRTGQPAQQRARFLQAIERREADAFMTHWEAVALMPELRNTIFGTVVPDEAHRMSNRKTAQTQAIKKLKAYHKLPMSGTMSADNPGGLWSIFHWLFPHNKYLGSYWRFFKDIVDFERGEAGYPIIYGLKPDGVARLHEFMEPFFVRHQKKEQCCDNHPDGVMPWLEDKYYDRIYVDLTPAQRRVYEQMKADMLAWVGENEDTPLAAQIAMVKALRLSQMCLAMPSTRPNVRWKVDKESGLRYQEEYDEVYFEPEAASAKMDRVVELLKDHRDKQFVLWTSSKRFMDIAVPRMSATGHGKPGITMVHVNSDVKDAARDEAKARFIRGDVQCFFGMIQTAEGIDGLQDASDTAIFFDRSWSTRMNNQAEDRIFRDGQKGSAQIIDVMARNTIELGNHQRMETKWGWLQLLLNGKINQETGATS